jgi:hypothetical protein
MAWWRTTVNPEDHNVVDGEFSDCEDDDAWEDAWEEERERLVDACAQKVIACWEDLSRDLGTHEAWDLLAAFLKHTKPKKKKGRHNPDFDNALLKAHDEAPRGKKAAATQAIGAKYKKSPAATDKHLRRLLKSRKHFSVAFKEFCERHSRGAILDK